MLTLYNTLTREKKPFAPLDPANVRMYVCGPTVYARPHLGNARSVVVYDVLYRLLRHLYGAEHVTYVRNITDVDDKINKAARENGETIQALTQRVTGWFHDDMDALNCLRPTQEPRATQYIPHMIAMIQKLIANGNAYVAEGHVLFDVESSPSPQPSPPLGEREATAQAGAGEGVHWYYGMLSGRKTEEQQAGARIAVESYKRNPGDFVLWKPADAEDDASSKFDSPWGVGRPGWHIECSAMSTDLLGETFDIHGGGADLKFPHHENEIAQSCCANPGSEFAKTWVHNGFLTVNGEKMAKSLGNFTTVRDLLDKGVHGEVIRLALLSAKYNEPLNWTEKLVEDAKERLRRWNWAIEARFIHGNMDEHKDYNLWKERYDRFLSEGEWEESWTSDDAIGLQKKFLWALCEDLNIPIALSFLHSMTELTNIDGAVRNNPLPIYDPQPFFSRRVVLKKCANLLGVLQQSKESNSEIASQIAARAEAKKAKNWAEADRIRDELKAQGIILEDRPDGTTDWRRA